MRTLKIIAIGLITLILSSCSGVGPFKACLDCTQFPLVYQGTIIEYTKGKYLETACLSIDLSKFSGFEEFQIGDIIFIKYTVKDGEFCSPNDRSTYLVYTIKNDKDGEWPARLTGQGEFITLKD